MALLIFRRSYSRAQEACSTDRHSCGLRLFFPLGQFAAYTSDLTRYAAAPFAGNAGRWPSKSGGYWKTLCDSRNRPSDALVRPKISLPYILIRIANIVTAFFAAPLGARPEARSERRKPQVVDPRYRYGCHYILQPFMGASPVAIAEYVTHTKGLLLFEVSLG